MYKKDEVRQLGYETETVRFRIDYRYLMINANSDAPSFFAKAASRAGDRVSFGILYTSKR